MQGTLRTTLWLGFFAAILASWWVMYVMSVDMDLDLLGRPGPQGQAMAAMDPRMPMYMPMANFGPLFWMWAIMMAAMMLPTLVPTLRAYEDLMVSANGTRPGWLGVLLGYFIVWVGFAAVITGAQLAFSNRTEAFSFNGVSPGALLSNFGSGTRTFIGQGPAGGRAELWIAGRRVAAAPIGIDGRYEITDAQIAYHLSRFIQNVRALSIDPIVVRQNWLDAYAYATDSAGFTRSKVCLSDNWYQPRRWQAYVERQAEDREKTATLQADHHARLACWISDRSPSVLNASSAPRPGKST